MNYYTKTAGYDPESCLNINNTLCNGKPIVAEHHYLWDNHILSNSAPHSGKTIIVGGVLQIDANVTFTNCTFLMASGASIDITNGHTLTLNGCTLMSACDEMWKGITADQSNEQIIADDCTLLDMEDGITVLNNAKVFATDNRFLDNYYGIRIINSTTVPQQVERNRFCGVNQLLPPHANEAKAVCGVYIQNSHNIDIGQPTDANSGNSFEQMRNGITVVMGMPFFFAPWQYQIGLHNNRFKDIHAAPGEGWDWSTYTGNRGWAIYGQGLNQNSVTGPLGSNLKLVVNNTLGWPANQQNFLACDKGILLRHSGGEVRNQNMDHTLLGVAMTEPQGRSFVVSGNTINRAFHGILKMGDESAAGCRVLSNSITLVNWQPGMPVYLQNQTGQAIISSYSSTATNGWTRIAGNTVNLALNYRGIGISLSGGYNGLITGNYIHILSNQAGNMVALPRVRGLSSNYTEKLAVIGNVVDNNFSVNNSTAYTTGNTVGFYLAANANSRFHCNISNFVRYGLLAARKNGSSTDHTFTSGNTLNGLDVDYLPWKLGVEGTMGQVGMEISTSPLSVFDADNHFLGQAQINHVYRITDCAQSFQDQIVTDAANLVQMNSTASNNNANQCEVIVTNPPTITETFNCAAAYPNTGTMEDPGPVVTTLNNQGDDYLFALMVAMDTMQYSEFPEGTRQAHEEMVYAWLRAKDSLRNSNPVLDSFYLSRFTGPIGQMNRVDALLAMLGDSTLMADSTAWLDTLFSARILNNQLTDTNQFIANARWINNRYMDMLEWSIDTLLGERADSIEALANSCPLLAGNAVYRARTVLGMLLPGLFYDDIELCNDQGVFKGGQSKLQEQLAQLNNYKQTPQALAVEGTLMIYPVPADQLLNVVLNCPPDQQAELQFFDLTGRPVSRNWIGGISPAAIDVHAWPRGMLLYRCVTANGEVFAGKIILK